MTSIPSLLSRLLRRQTATATAVPPHPTTKIPIRTAQTQASSAQTQAFRPSQSGPPIDDLISQLPLVQSLRRDPGYTESRPHLSMPANLRPSHFVAGSLSGLGKVTVAPYMFSSKSSSSPQREPETEPGVRRGSRVVSVFHIGSQMCGHPGFVHGGLLSVMFDEAFARCVAQSFPSGVGMTANLNVDYRKPAVPERVYVLRAETVKLEGRKAWVEGTMTSLPGRGEADRGEPVMVAEAKALFVEPRFAESMAPVYRN